MIGKSSKGKFVAVFGFVVLAVGGGLIAWKVGAFSSDERGAAHIKSEVGSIIPTSSIPKKGRKYPTDIKSGPWKVKSILQGREIRIFELPKAIESVEELHQIFLKLAKNADGVAIDPLTPVGLVVRTFEQFGSDTEAMKGAAVYFDAINSVYYSQQLNSPCFTFLELANLFRIHSELKIDKPLKLEEVTFSKAKLLYIPDVASVKLIEFNTRLEPFFTCLGKYYDTLRFNLNFDVNETKRVEEVLGIARSFFIGENKKRYPKFFQIYEEQVKKLNNSLSSKVKPKDLKPYHHLVDFFYMPELHIPFVTHYLASDLSSEDKEEIFVSFLLSMTMQMMYKEIVDLRNSVHDPQIIGEFKEALFREYQQQSKRKYVIAKSSKFDPECDAEGKWIQTGNANACVISNALIKECEQLMAAYCKNHPSTFVKVDDIEDIKYDIKLDEKRSKLQSEAAKSYAVKII